MRGAFQSVPYRKRCLAIKAERHTEAKCSSSGRGCRTQAGKTKPWNPSAKTGGRRLQLKFEHRQALIYRPIHFVQEVSQGGDANLLLRMSSRMNPFQSLLNPIWKDPGVRQILENWKAILLQGGGEIPDTPSSSVSCPIRDPGQIPWALFQTHQVKCPRPNLFWHVWSPKVPDLSVTSL